MLFTCNSYRLFELYNTFQAFKPFDQDFLKIQSFVINISLLVSNIWYILKLSRHCLNIYGDAISLYEIDVALIFFFFPL